MFGDQLEECRIFIQLVNDIVRQKHDLVFKQPYIGFLQIPVSLFKDQAGPVRDQFITDVCLILKVEIKGSLGNSRLTDDIRDGCLLIAILRKQMVRRIKQRCLLSLFIFFYFTHWRSSPFWPSFFIIIYKK